jgi:hypothetical protein
MASIHQPPAQPVVREFPTIDALKEALASFIINAQKEVFEKKGRPRFTIALSGGSLPDMLSGLIGKPDVKWKHWYTPPLYTCILGAHFRLTGMSSMQTSESFRLTIRIRITV